MEEDLVLSLTRQVKEEVVENYLLERRLIELQVEHLNTQAAEIRRQASITGMRLARLSALMIAPDMRCQLLEMLGVGACGFWVACLDEKFKDSVRLIPAKALTHKAKFRKVLLESYSRLCHRMKQYREQYEEIQKELSAVNCNIDSFQRNYDLLSILNFLRSLDVQGIERKKILGDNFTAQEMASLDKNLYISCIPMEKLDVPPPLDLPESDLIRRDLCDLAEEIFKRYHQEVKKILRSGYIV
jgi:DNA-binding ferritin-like protein (Dps family)